MPPLPHCKPPAPPHERRFDCSYRPARRIPVSSPAPAPLCAVLCAPLVLLAVLPEAGSPAVFHGCSISSVITPAKSRITAKLAATKPANEGFFFFLGGWPRRGGVLPGRWGGLCPPDGRRPLDAGFLGPWPEGRTGRAALPCAGRPTGTSTDPSGTSVIPRCRAGPGEGRRRSEGCFIQSSMHRAPFPCCEAARHATAPAGHHAP